MVLLVFEIYFNENLINGFFFKSTNTPPTPKTNKPHPQNKKNKKATRRQLEINSRYMNIIGKIVQNVKVKHLSVMKAPAHKLQANPKALKTTDKYNNGI